MRYEWFTLPRIRYRDSCASASVSLPLARTHQIRKFLRWCNVLVVVALMCLPVVGTYGQVAWAYEDATQSSAALIYIEQPDGTLLGNRYISQLGGSQINDLLEFSSQGEATEHVIAWPVGWSLVASWLYPRETGYDAWAFVSADQLDQIGRAFVHLSSDFEITESVLHEFPDSLRLFGSVRTHTPNGGMAFVQFCANNQIDPSLIAYLRFEHYSPTGELLHLRHYPCTGGVIRQVVPTTDGFAVAFSSLSGLGPAGFGKVLRFDENLNYQNGFVLPDVNGAVQTPGQDSLLSITGLFPLRHGRSIVAGYYDYHPGADVYSWQASLLKLDSSGHLVARRDATPASFHSETLQTIGLRPLSDTTFLWCYFESDQMNEYGDRHKFVVVDTSLNVLQTTTFHTGFPEQVIDLLDVMRTADGGYVISGTISPAPFTGGRAYVAKIGGRTGLPEPLRGMALRCHPNPGSSFTLHWTGPAVPDARLSIHDAQGRSVHFGTLTTDDLVLTEAESWSSGLYTYRVTDKGGRLLQSGKWIKW